MKELIKMPSFWVGITVSIITLTTLTGILLFPEEIKVISPTLMLVGLIIG